MTRSKTALIVLLLAACSGDSSTPAPPAVTPNAPTTGSTAPTGGAATVSTVGASSAEPWAVIAGAVDSLGDDERAMAVNDLIELRSEDRNREDKQIERGLLGVEAALSAGCDGEGASEAFTVLQEVESASLAADRAALSDILTEAGPDGRKLLWEATSVESVATKSRATMAEAASRNLPAWVSSDSDPEKELLARQTLLGLKFVIEANGLEVDTRISEATSLIKRLDPEAEDTPAQVVQALAAVDAGLLEGQQTKFEKLLPACENIDMSYWLTLLESGNIRRYLGGIGGSAEGSTGPTPPAGGAMASVGGLAASNGGAGAMGRTQMGGTQSGGQMGGTQGGGQMGGTQSGGQMGGTQSGGQMGGTQGGGQMGGTQGGGQMGGTQSGGQMGGTQGGGQMGGSQSGGQMGGTQSGGQMGGTQSGGQMGGTQSGGQMGGSQGGGQMGGTQSGGQMGGSQSGGQMGGTQGGGQMGGTQGGGQMGGAQGGGQQPPQ